MSETKPSRDQQQKADMPLLQATPRSDNGPLKRLLREAEAATYIGMSRSFLKQGRYTGPVEGQIPPPPYVLMGKRTVRYLKEDLDAWIAQFPKMVSHHLDPEEAARTDYD